MLARLAADEPAARARAAQLQVEITGFLATLRDPVARDAMAAGARERTS